MGQQVLRSPQGEAMASLPVPPRSPGLGHSDDSVNRSSPEGRGPGRQRPELLQGSGTGPRRTEWGTGGLSGPAPYALRVGPSAEGLGHAMSSSSVFLDS